MRCDFGPRAGNPVEAKLGAWLGGINVLAESGRFAARPSGAEEIYKINAERSRSDEQLQPG
jgi:phosphoglucomutase